MVDLGDDEIRYEEWAGLVVLPNSSDQTFAQVRTDRESWVALVGAIDSLAAPARAVVWATAFDLVAHAELPPAELLIMLDGHLAAEPLPAIWEPVAGRALRELPRWLSPDQVFEARSVLARLAAATLERTSSLRLAATRLQAASASDPDLMHSWLDAGRTDRGVVIDADLRWKVLGRLAELGAVDPARIDTEAADDRSTQGETGAARARAAIPTPEAKEHAWTVLSGPEVDNRVFGATAAGLWVPEQADLVAPYVARYLAEAPTWAERRGQGFSRLTGFAFPRHAVTETTRDGLREALTSGVPAVLRRAWEDQLDDLELDLVVRRGRRTSR